MKIKKVSELNEGLTDRVSDNNKKIQKIKSLIEEIYDDNASFPEYWDRNGDRLIQEFNILQEKPKQIGNIREVLPQMVQLSNNSQITQQTAQRIVDSFSPSELNDFKRWLQLIHR